MCTLTLLLLGSAGLAPRCIASILWKGQCFLQISTGPPRCCMDIEPRLNKYLKLLLPVFNNFQM